MSLMGQTKTPSANAGSSTSFGVERREGWVQLKKKVSFELQKSIGKRNFDIDYYYRYFFLKKKEMYLVLMEGALYWFKREQIGVQSLSDCSEKPRGSIVCSAGVEARELVGEQRGSFAVIDDRG